VTSNDPVETLSALAADSRLNILRALAVTGREGMKSGDIAEQLDVQQSTLSTQLFLLWKARLVEKRREGRNIIYNVNLNTFRDLVGFLNQDCTGGRLGKVGK
jgi:ArsR family transcriptional regulator